MGAAFLALGEALVDAIAVRLVGDDEHAAVGRSQPTRRGGTHRPKTLIWIACCTGEREDYSSFDKPKTLIMINHAGRGGLMAEIGFQRP